MKTTKKTTRRPQPLGARILRGLTELRDVLASGEPLEKHFRVDRIEIPDPPRFSAAEIKRLRNRLSATQRLFARLVGVSPELVEHWEQGIRSPRPIACRLLNEIAHDPDGFVKRLGKSRIAKAA